MTETRSHFGINVPDFNGDRSQTVALVATQALATEAAAIIGDGNSRPARIRPVAAVVATTLAEIDHPAIREHLRQKAIEADPAGYAAFRRLQAQFEPAGR